MAAGKAVGMDLFVGLDVGTSAVKGVMVSSTGVKIRTARRPTTFLHPEPGQTELDPEEHYRSVCAVIRELAGSAPPGSRVRGLAMAAASGNMLLTDGAGRPVTNIVSWLDTRAYGKGPELLPGVEADQVHEVTGWPLGESFPFVHLAWMRRYRPDAWRQAAHVGMNTDWLLHRLTGRWGMDHSTATTSYLQDQQSGRWHQPHLDLLGIREAQLSPLRPSGSALGTLTPEAVHDTGLERDTVVCLGCFDHPAAARGTGVFEAGDLLLSCGTSWVGFYPVTDRALPIRLGLIVDPFLGPQRTWGAMFALTAVGVTLDRHIDRLVSPGAPIAARYDAFNAHAAACPRGAGGLAINIYGYRLRFAEDVVDPSLAAYPPAQIARALMEGVSYEVRRNIEGLGASGIAARRLVMAGGPTESAIWPRIVAEVTGLELELINGQVAGALGAAILAAMGAGLFRDEAEAFRAMGGEGTRIRPDADGVRVYDALYREYISRNPPHP
jgi:xylulokinase